MPARKCGRADGLAKRDSATSSTVPGISSLISLNRFVIRRSVSIERNDIPMPFCKNSIVDSLLNRCLSGFNAGMS